MAFRKALTVSKERLLEAEKRQKKRKKAKQKRRKA